MKKILNTLLVALFTVSASINFAACSSDNDDENNVINNEAEARPWHWLTMPCSSTITRLSVCRSS